MAARIWVIPAHHARRERWRNGLGWTREIARWTMPAQLPGTADDPWDVRLSIAEIDEDAAFSSFPGIDRELVLLAGNGMTLAFDDGEQVPVEPPHGRHRFAGERGLAARLHDGRTLDFNLMWRRARCDAALWHRPLVGPMVVFGDPGSVWAVHLIAGEARIGDSGRTALNAGDTVVWVAGESRLRQVVEGAGEALVMRVSPTGGGVQDADADAARPGTDG